MAFLALAAAFAGCTKTQESTGGPAAGTLAPSIVAVTNEGWRASPSGQAVKILVVNVTAHGDTTLRWRDFLLNTTNGALVPASAYVRLANGTSFGWSADRTLADGETLTAELHYRANGTAGGATNGYYAGPFWQVAFALPPESDGSPPFG